MLPVIFLSVLGSALAENCTSDGEIQGDNCVPQIIMDYKTIFIFNIVIIILIGTFGNLLTLLALPYARYYYRRRFSHLSSSTTILLLHLALCDLCYLVLGLSVQAWIFNNGHLNASELFCSWNAWVRNMLCCADFFTIGVIAFTRTVNIVCSQAGLVRLNLMFSPSVACISCLLIWILAFLILSPTLFGVEGFGSFGYDPQQGKCEIKGGTEVIIFTLTTTVSCLVITGSYIILSLYINIQAKNTLASASRKSRNTSINRTLLTLSLAFILFTSPSLPLDFGFLDSYLEGDKSALASLCFSSWYWWIYAINFLVYSATTQDFRIMYRLFMADTCIKFGAGALSDSIMSSQERQSLI